MKRLAILIALVMAFGMSGSVFAGERSSNSASASMGYGNLVQPDRKWRKYWWHRDRRDRGRHYGWWRGRHRGWDRDDRWDRRDHRRRDSRWERRDRWDDRRDRWDDRWDRDRDRDRRRRHRDRYDD